MAHDHTITDLISERQTKATDDMADDSALLMMAKVLEAQKPKAHEMKEAPAFYQNMEKVLDKRRKDQTMLTLLPARPVVDFSSCDILSLSKYVYLFCPTMGGKSDSLVIST